MHGRHYAWIRRFIIIVLLLRGQEGLMGTVARAQTQPAVRRELPTTGLFDWQMPIGDKKHESWNKFTFDPARWWGTFPPDEQVAIQGARDDAELFRKFPWAIGPFVKYAANPVLAPTPGKWDQGRYDGGVHNGAIVRHDGKFCYVYRGERPIDVKQNSKIDYICDIGLATSDDGVNFVKDEADSPFFRKDGSRRFSYEDVCLVRNEGVYYLFCNQWLWEDHNNTAVNGTFLATSTDLKRWETHGIVFPRATRIHRNGVVVQDPENNAVRVNGKFVMYLNDGLIAYSDDLLHWESHDIVEQWPGGEGCFALTDHDPARADDLVLFTGGHHHGHFYAIGQVLFSKRDPTRAVAYLPQPALAADPAIPHESGCSAQAPHQPISSFRDCIFFNGLTRHDGKWWMYYGGSEYYTCLATAPAR
jgi:predicted GH43/DUF377 family glycosyl hydrolase